MTSKWIVIEGPDYAGKTEQAKRLSETLNAVYVREPGGTDFGERIREILKYQSRDADPIGRFLLFAAARVDIINNLVLPHLKDGKSVVMDRFYLSTQVYQTLEIPNPELIETLHRATVTAEPHTKIVLIPTLDTVLKRREAATRDLNDHYDNAPIDRLNAILESYKALAPKMGYHCIDADLPANDVTALINSLVLSN